MSQERISLFCFWGGNVIDADGDVGYDRAFKRCIRITSQCTYPMLMAKLYQAARMDPAEVILRVVCRYPIIGSAGQILHRPLQLVDDDTVEAMFAIVQNLNRNHCDVYLEFEPIDHVTGGNESNLPVNDPTVEFVGSYNEVMPSAPNNEPENQIATTDQPTSVAVRDYVQQQDMSWDYVTDQADNFNIADGPLDEDDIELQHMDMVPDEVVGVEAPNEYDELAAQRLHEPMSETFTAVEVDDSALHWAPSLRQRTWNPENEDPCVGQLFKDKEHLIQSMKLYTIRSNQVYVTVQSKRNSWVAECPKRKEGQCQWRVRASKLSSHGLFEITKYEGPHTCIFARLTEDHEQLDSNFLSSNIVHLVKSNPACSILSLQAELKDRFKYSVSYRKVWLAKQKAIAKIFGDWEQSYLLLPRFMNAVQHYNPGTVVHYRHYPYMGGAQRVLQYVFWSFKPSIDGFAHCIPVVSIDGTHLYGKYMGKLLIAMAQDANLQVFPLAFAWVDVEDNDSWMYFLRMLRRHVCGDRQLCLISDRHSAILSTVSSPQSGWANANHCFCLRHIEANFKKKWPAKQLIDLLNQAGRATQVRKFNEAMELLRSINEGAWKFLNDLPKEKWTFCYGGAHRYGIMTTNLSECFNNVLRGARSLPITAAVQLTFYKLVSYFHQRRLIAMNATSNGARVGPRVQKLLTDFQKDALAHQVMEFNHVTGECQVVTGSHLSRGSNTQIVRLRNGMCSCGKWEVLRLPCSHVIAACDRIRIDWMQFVSDVYSIKSYVDSYMPEFHPLAHEDYWPSIQTPYFIPNPNLLRERGRPVSTRLRNEMDRSERSSAQHCGICKQQGHDRRKCPSRASSSSSATRIFA